MYTDYSYSEFLADLFNGDTVTSSSVISDMVVLPVVDMRTSGNGQIGTALLLGGGTVEIHFFDMNNHTNLHMPRGRSSFLDIKPT